MPKKNKSSNKKKHGDSTPVSCAAAATPPPPDQLSPTSGAAAIQIPTQYPPPPGYYASTCSETKESSEEQSGPFGPNSTVRPPSAVSIIVEDSPPRDTPIDESLISSSTAAHSTGSSSPEQSSSIRPPSTVPEIVEDSPPNYLPTVETCFTASNAAHSAGFHVLQRALQSASPSEKESLTALFLAMGSFSGAQVAEVLIGAVNDPSSPDPPAKLPAEDHHGVTNDTPLQDSSAPASVCSATMLRDLQAELQQQGAVQAKAANLLASSMKQMQKQQNKLVQLMQHDSPSTKSQRIELGSMPKSAELPSAVPPAAQNNAPEGNYGAYLLSRSQAPGNYTCTTTQVQRQHSVCSDLAAAPFFKGNNTCTTKQHQQRNHQQHNETPQQQFQQQQFQLEQDQQHQRPSIVVQQHFAHPNMMSPHHPDSAQQQQQQVLPYSKGLGKQGRAHVAKQAAAAQQADQSTTVMAQQAMQIFELTQQVKQQRQQQQQQQQRPSTIVQQQFAHPYVSPFDSTQRHASFRPGLQAPPQSWGF
eukprot:CAMPEP_0171903222 /NCGR_PEP_ID=MMETSP0993-20121228/2728_1 /TAXON_ID=483369 /ORGANISM="non described non described, Strain CCMP2098" /LENGTH=528 /DNA_ID=CAMNT_0012533335 /DNA_START=843 /DNA_END=2429 /DNA_ORIENTATION=+